MFLAINFNRLDTTGTVDKYLNSADNRASRLGQEEGNISHVRWLHESADRDCSALGLDDISGHGAIGNTSKLIKQRCVPRSRADSVESELVLGKLKGHGLCGGRDTGLCSVIPCLGSTRSDGVLARDNDSRARAVLLHLGNKYLRSEIDAFDINVKEAVELFNGNLNAGLVGIGPASVMDDDRGSLSKTDL